MLFTLEDIQGEADFHLLSLDKLFIGPVSLKRLRFTPGELPFDQLLSSLASDPLKGWSGLTLLHDDPLPAN